MSRFNYLVGRFSRVHAWPVLGVPQGRENMDQAGGYVEDLLACGLIDGTPRFRAFVVGHSVDPKMQCKRDIDGIHTMQATQYSVLFRTGHLRLFKLRDKLQSR